MPYHNSITRNLPLFCPPGIQVTLSRLGRHKVQFRIENESRSFLLGCDHPDIFSFVENKKQLKKFFADAYRRYESR